MSEFTFIIARRQIVIIHCIKSANSSEVYCITWRGVATGGGIKPTAAAIKKVKRPGALTVPGKRIKDYERISIKDGYKTKCAIRYLAKGYN